MKNKKINEMKVLNIAQPNAHNVMFNGKNIENRSMPSNIRGTIAIYASKTCSKERFDNQDIGNVRIEECSFGNIIGFVNVVDCVVESQLTDKTKKWFHGPYGYVLEKPITLVKPIAVSPPKGAIIWWTLDGAKLSECLAQVSTNEIISLTKAETPNDTPKQKVKTGGRTQLIPSAALSKLIGDQPTTYKKAASKVIDYIESNDLFDPEAEVIRADKALVLIFGKKIVSFKEFKSLLLEQLDYAS